MNTGTVGLTICAVSPEDQARFDIISSHFATADW